MKNAKKNKTKQNKQQKRMLAGIYPLECYI